MENEELILNEDIKPTPEPEPFVIPLIYNYKADTKEFTGVVEQADKDNAKSAQVGHFVPMVHANATLLEPPKAEENQIQVYSKTVETREEPYEVIDYEIRTEEYEEQVYDEEGNPVYDEDGNPVTEIKTREIQVPVGSHTEYRTVEEVVENWDTEADYRKNFYKVDNDLNVTDITTIGEQEGYIVVDKATGEDIKTNQDWYKIVDNKVVKKSDEEYEQEQADRRETEFNKAFFNTSLGYIRRKVTMKDDSKKDFLSDLVLSIKAGLEQGLDVKILTYDKPPFDRDIEDWTVYQHIVSATPQFIMECLMQTSNDFLPINED